MLNNNEYIENYEFVEDDYEYDELSYNESLDCNPVILEEELIELEKSINLRNAIQIMIDKRFGGNINGIRGINNNKIYKNVNYKINFVNKQFDKKDITLNTNPINNIRIEHFRKQQEFGARKRIKP
jgi:hypothetical protein